MTRSTWTSGSIRPASLPARCMAERIAARSRTAGTPVKSCSRIRAGRDGSSAAGAARPGPGQASHPAETASRDTARLRLPEQAFQQDLDRHGQAGGIAEAEILEACQRKVIKFCRGKFVAHRDHVVLMLAASVAIPAVKLAM